MSASWLSRGAAYMAARERLEQLVGVGERAVRPRVLGDPRRVLEQRAEPVHEGRLAELVDGLHPS